MARSLQKISSMLKNILKIRRTVYLGIKMYTMALEKAKELQQYPVSEKESFFYMYTAYLNLFRLHRTGFSKGLQSFQTIYG